MSANVHSLLHLTEVVKDLWGHSCFAFEHANGQLLKNFHGSQSLEKQVRTSYDKQAGSYTAS